MVGGLVWGAMSRTRVEDREIRVSNLGQTTRLSAPSLGLHDVKRHAVTAEAIRNSGLISRITVGPIAFEIDDAAFGEVAGSRLPEDSATCSFSLQVMHQAAVMLTNAGLPAARSASSRAWRTARHRAPPACASSRSSSPQPAPIPGRGRGSMAHHHQRRRQRTRRARPAVRCAPASRLPEPEGKGDQDHPPQRGQHARPARLRGEHPDQPRRRGVQREGQSCLNRSIQRARPRQQAGHAGIQGQQQIGKRQTGPSDEEDADRRDRRPRQREADGDAMNGAVQGVATSAASTPVKKDRRGRSGRQTRCPAPSRTRRRARNNPDRFNPRANRYRHRRRRKPAICNWNPQPMVRRPRLSAISRPPTSAAKQVSTPAHRPCRRRRIARGSFSAWRSTPWPSSTAPGRRTASD